MGSTPTPGTASNAVPLRRHAFVSESSLTRHLKYIFYGRNVRRFKILRIYSFQF